MKPLHPASGDDFGLSIRDRRPDPGPLSSPACSRAPPRPRPWCATRSSLGSACRPTRLKWCRDSPGPTCRCARSRSRTSASAAGALIRLSRNRSAGPGRGAGPRSSTRRPGARPKRRVRGSSPGWRARLPCGSLAGRAGRGSTRFCRRERRGRRRDERFWHGHRPSRRPRRHPPWTAQLDRGLLSRGWPGRPRRRRRAWAPAHLFP